MKGTVPSDEVPTDVEEPISFRGVLHGMIPNNGDMHTGLPQGDSEAQCIVRWLEEVDFKPASDW